MDKKEYQCKICGLQWHTVKEFDECPDCHSKDIELITVEGDEQLTKPTGQLGSGRNQQMGRRMGGGPPRVCKCHECGYESPKTPGVPCRQTKCPECGRPLCGSD